jgi:hypothetical protein
MTWIFTFGYGQTDPKTGRSLADRYVRVPIDGDAPVAQAVEAARRKMLARFGGHERGGNWAFDYPTRDAAGVDRYALTEIDFETGEAIR